MELLLKLQHRAFHEDIEGTSPPEGFRSKDMEPASIWVSLLVKKHHFWKLDGHDQVLWPTYPTSPNPTTYSMLCFLCVPSIAPLPASSRWCLGWTSSVAVARSQSPSSGASADTARGHLGGAAEGSVWVLGFSPRPSVYVLCFVFLFMWSWIVVSCFICWRGFGGKKMWLKAFDWWFKFASLQWTFVSFLEGIPNRSAHKPTNLESTKTGRRNCLK